MASDTRRLKGYRVARAWLGFAVVRLPESMPLHRQFQELPERQGSEDDRNALVGFLDEMVKAADSLCLRGRFWKDLIRAAETLEVPDRIPHLRTRYREALKHVGEGDFDG